MRLTLVFSRWMSLARWDELGMFDRETALYRRLSCLGVDISFLTWGDAKDLDFAGRLPGISILCNRWNLPGRRYERLAPFLHASRLWRSHVVKTNQSSAAAIALPAAGLWRRPLLARMGFMASEFAQEEYGDGSPEHRQELAREDRLFQAARTIAVTTQAMADSARRRHPGLSGRIEIVPNFVDTDLFAPMPGEEKRYDLVFIARLARQKNFDSFLEAIRRLGCKALVVGDGPLAPMAGQAVADGVIDWKKSVPHSDLPRLIAQSRLFILPSLWEGHPKTLIEAMAAGAAVIGARSPGIEDVIRHGETGLLCGSEPGDIAEAIRSLLGNPALQESLGAEARAFARSTWSLERIAAQELSLLHTTAGIRT
ncbi:MAG: glycosyltransferase family 4 protein [Rhodospirillales bacterium]|jgi:glycosyltransferase involved in cell wall biosynthesis